MIARAATLQDALNFSAWVEHDVLASYGAARELTAVYSDDGDPVLLYGVCRDDAPIIIPVPESIARFKVGFGRYTRKAIEAYHFRAHTLQHELSAKTRRWAEWLGFNLPTVH
jgi:hypothetical protein